jgi:hypothetical protein
VSKGIDPILGNYLPIEEFAKLVHKDRRTITRWHSEPNGLPYLRLGRETLIPVDRARDWLESRIHANTGQPRPRSRGRR